MATAPLSAALAPVTRDTAATADAYLAAPLLPLSSARTGLGSSPVRRS